MDSMCQKVKNNWAEYTRKTLSPREQEAIARHLTTCAECRAFAYAQRFPAMLQEALGKPPPEPSERYYASLRQKLQSGNETEVPGVPELLAQQAWRLIPALALLLVIITASLFYEYTRLAFFPQPLDETIIFEDSALTEQNILGAIISEDEDHGI